MAKEESTLQDFQTNNVGTYHWMAPEIITDNVYSTKSDAYSFSIFLWELFANKNPYDNFDNIKELLEYIIIEEGRPDLH